MSRVSEVEVRNVFHTITITLEHAREDLPVYSGTDPSNYRVDMVEGDVYRVSAVCLYHMGGRGAMVEGVREWSFRDLTEARNKANGYFAHLTCKGWERTK